jgi:PilZ domain
MTLKHSSHHHRLNSTGLIAATTVTRSQIAKRRSNRMTLSAAIGLSGEDRQKSSFSMPARATNLNKHGAAVQLGRELEVGTVVIVQNKRGAQVSARVVAKLAPLQGVSTYGIEFVEQDDGAKNFWGITFPSNA